jgi:hypothetical protein
MLLTVAQSVYSLNIQSQVNYCEEGSMEYKIYAVTQKKVNTAHTSCTATTQSWTTNTIFLASYVQFIQIIKNCTTVMTQAHTATYKQQPLLSNAQSTGSWDHE